MNERTLPGPLWMDSNSELVQQVLRRVAEARQRSYLLPRPRKGSVADVRAFQEAREILAGRLRPLPTGGAQKMMSLILGDEREPEPFARDVIISPGVFEVTYLGSLVSQYMMDAVPGVISSLLDAAGLDGPQASLSGVRARSHQLRRSVCTVQAPARRFWLAHDESAIVLAVRSDTPDSADAPWPQPIGRRPMIYRQLSPPQPCPRCRESLSRVRVVDDDLVCTSCGHSFPASGLSLAR